MKINLIIERFENNEAILKDQAGLIVGWPKSKLPPGAKEKDEIAFSIGAEIEPQKNENLAKNILNEILNIEQ